MKMEDKLNELAMVALDHVTDPINDYSLLGGYLGEIYFLYQYSRIDSTYEEKADMALDKLLGTISIKDGYFVTTYCNGFAGLGIALHLLEDDGFIEGAGELLDDVDKLLAIGLTRDFTQKNYDFLHGAVGVGFYFIKHYTYAPEVSKTQLERIVDFLEETSMVDEATGLLKWEDIGKNFDTGEMETKFNISLSHGMSSISIFLARLLQLNLLDEAMNVRIKAILEKAIDYILAQRIDFQTYGSYFPSCSIESDKVLHCSRLGWCYGDLGVAVALWQAGNVLGRQDCTDLSREVLLYSGNKRRDLKLNFVFDAGLCHGAAGIAQIFYRMSKEMELPELFDAYEYWKSVTLDMGYHEEGWGGYMMYNAKENSWTNTANVLEGTSGIGLMLMSPVYADWDEILLLSFK